MQVSNPLIMQVQQKLSEADASTEQRLGAMNKTLQTAVAASSSQQAEHNRLQSEMATLQEQLTRAQNLAANPDETRSRDLEHQRALQVPFEAILPR